MDVNLNIGADAAVGVQTLLLVLLHQTMSAGARAVACNERIDNFG